LHQTVSKLAPSALHTHEWPTIFLKALLFLLGTQGGILCHEFLAEGAGIECFPVLRGFFLAGEMPDGGKDDNVQGLFFVLSLLADFVGYG
jgi:hypothetical protein